jgi:hypothetical protein
MGFENPLKLLLKFIGLPLPKNIISVKTLKII